MQKKRLEDALNAGKLIRLGFSLNHAKPEKLNILYYINCCNDMVYYANDEQIKSQIKVNNNPNNLNSKNSSSSEYEDNSDSSTKSITKSTKKNQSSTKKNDKSDEYDKVEILCLKFNQNLNLLGTGDSNGIVKIYDVFSGNPIKSEDTDKSDDDDSDDENSKLKRRTSPDTFVKQSFKSLISSKKISPSHVYNMPTICMKWYPYSNYSTGLLYYAHVNGYIGIMDKETLKKSIVIEEEDEISCIEFNNDGSCMASVGKDYTVKLYDANINNSTFNKVVKSYGCNALENNPLLIGNPYMFESKSLNQSSTSVSSTHTNRLQSVKFSNVSNDILFTGGWDRTVKIWDKRTVVGLVNTINGPFICGSDAIDNNDNLLLTASWVKDNALNLWDIRHCHKKVCTLPIIIDQSDKENSKFDSNSNSSFNSMFSNSDARKNGEYLYACKFFSSSSLMNQIGSKNKNKANKTIEVDSGDNNYSTVLACGSGTQSLHLIDYEKPAEKQHLASIHCNSPLYCLDAIYSWSLIACGGMRRCFTMMATSANPPPTA